MISLGDKIKFYRLKAQLTQEDLASSLGKSKNVISNWERGDNKPDADTIEKLCSILKVSPNNLLIWNEQNGINDMFDTCLIELTNKYTALDMYGKKVVDLVLNLELERVKTESEKNMKTKTLSSNKVKESSVEYTCNPESRVYPEGVVPIDSYQTEDDEDDTRISMPVYDLGASAGTGVFLDNPCYEMVSMPEDRLSRKANFALWVSGNSMEPRFHNGDLVLVKIQPTVEIGEIGIFILNGEGYIKKWGGDKLISLNIEYDPIEIGENDTLYCKGKVIGNA